MGPSRRMKEKPASKEQGRHSRLSQIILPNNRTYLLAGRIWTGITYGKHVAQPTHACELGLLIANAILFSPPGSCCQARSAQAQGQDGRLVGALYRLLQKFRPLLYNCEAEAIGCLALAPAYGGSDLRMLRTTKSEIEVIEMLKERARWLKIVEDLCSVVNLYNIT